MLTASHGLPSTVIAPLGFQHSRGRKHAGYGQSPGRRPAAKGQTACPLRAHPSLVRRRCPSNPLITAQTGFSSAAVLARSSIAAEGRAVGPAPLQTPLMPSLKRLRTPLRRLLSKRSCCTARSRNTPAPLAHAWGRSFPRSMHFSSIYSETVHVILDAIVSRWHRHQLSLGRSCSMWHHIICPMQMCRGVASASDSASGPALLLYGGRRLGGCPGGRLLRSRALPGAPLPPRLCQHAGRRFAGLSSCRGRVW